MVINEVRYSILTLEGMVPYIDSAPPQYFICSRSRKYIRNIVDPESDHEGRNPSPPFLLASCAQEPAMEKVFHTINYCDAATPESVILAELHFYLRLYQSESSYGRGEKKKVRDKEYKRKRKQYCSKHNTDAEK